MPLLQITELRVVLVLAQEDKLVLPEVLAIRHLQLQVKAVVVAMGGVAMEVQRVVAVHLLLEMMVLVVVLQQVELAVLVLHLR